MANNSQIIKRLLSARGHLDKVIKMVQSDDYCIDILQQSVAVQSALKRADEEILSSHLSSCVSKNMSQKQRDEIVEVFRKGRR